MKKRLFLSQSLLSIYILLSGTFMFCCTDADDSGPPSLPTPITFEQTYGSEGDDFGMSVQQTTDKGYIVSGTANRDLFILKVDECGTEEWSWINAIGDYDFGKSVQQVSNGGYIIGGYTNINNPGYPAKSVAFLLRTESSGHELWYQPYGNWYRNSFNSVQQTTDSGYIACGATEWSYNNSDVYLVRTDSQGNELWFRHFGGSGWEIAYSVQQTIDGGFILCGDTDYNDTDYSDYYLIKTDEQGNEEWSNTFGGNNRDVAYSVQQTTDGGYIICGDSHPGGSGYYNILLVKTNQQGEEEWSRIYGGSYFDMGRCVRQTSDHGFIICGSSAQYGYDNLDVYVIKTDTQGQEEWSQKFGQNAHDYGRVIKQTLDGGFIICGDRGFPITDNDVYLIKTDQQGHVDRE